MHYSNLPNSSGTWLSFEIFVNKLGLWCKIEASPYHHSGGSLWRSVGSNKRFYWVDSTNIVCWWTLQCLAPTISVTCQGFVFICNNFTFLCWPYLKSVHEIGYWENLGLPNQPPFPPRFLRILVIIVILPKGITSTSKMAASQFCRTAPSTLWGGRCILIIRTSVCSGCHIWV